MMILTNREEQLLEEIYKWEESLQSVEATEMELLYEEWLEKGLNLIPASVRETYLHKIDEKSTYLGLPRSYCIRWLRDA